MIRKSEGETDIVKPVYFPFTYVSGAMIDILNQYIGSVVFYQPVAGNDPPPVKERASTGGIEVRSPVQGDEDHIIEAARRCKNWGTAHHGNMDAFRVSTGPGFYNETFAAEIRSEIKGKKSGQNEPDPMFSARLFLCLAQEFDMQQAELQAELSDSELNRKKMFSELKGDEGSRLPISEMHVSEDPGKYQTGKRVLSWLRLAAADKEPRPVLITTSRAVFDHIIEFVPQASIIKIFDPLPADEAFQSTLRNYFAELVDSGQPAEVVPPVSDSFLANASGVRLTVAVLPVKTPADCLGRLLSENRETAGVFVRDGYMVVNLLEVIKV